MYSGLDGKTHVFTWTIENYKACTSKNGFSLKSPVFVAESLDGTTWYILLYPRGKESTTREYVSCYLHRSIDSSGPLKYECDYTLEAFDGNNESLRKYQYVSELEKGTGIGWEEFLERDSIFNKQFSCDSLTIRATLKKKIPKLFTKNSCRTKLATDRYSFKWDVKNAMYSSANTRNVSFSETLQFKLKVEIPDDEVEISLKRKKGFDGFQILICGITLLDLKGEDADFQEAVLEADDPGESETWKFPTFLKKSKIAAEKDKYLNEDYFTLRFDFSLSDGKILESIKDTECKSLDCFLKTKENPSSTLKTDLMHVYSNHILTDVVLRAGRTVIRAHKVILCARSPVFLAMFNQDMAENQSGLINILDVEPKTLNSLLEFMYTGDTDIQNYESALELLLAADKYQVLSLKEQCSSSLELFISDENVCDVLFTADLIHLESLKVCAMNYIKENSRKIFVSSEWKQLVEKNLKLATETVFEVSSYMAT